MGASPGTVEGVAAVVLDGSSAAVAPDAILVTEKTTPTMTPLLITAAGIVTDQGGLVSHAAVVARELGIPCVVGCEEATALIRPGVALRVDGAAGTVEVLHDADGAS
jgi:pyruvate,water dikinase